MIQELLLWCLKNKTLTILASEILLSNIKLTQFLRTSSLRALLSMIFCLSPTVAMAGPIGTILFCERAFVCLSNTQQYTNTCHCFCIAAMMGKYWKKIAIQTNLSTKLRLTYWQGVFYISSLKLFIGVKWFTKWVLLVITDGTSVLTS